MSTVKVDGERGPSEENKKVNRKSLNYPPLHEMSFPLLLSDHFRAQTVDSGRLRSTTQFAYLKLRTRFFSWLSNCIQNHPRLVFSYFLWFVGLIICLFYCFLHCGLCLPFDICLLCPSESRLIRPPSKVAYVRSS